MNYSLLADGDGVEKKYYSLFIGSQFPSYEGFWRNFVIPLTNRPANVQLKTDAELAAIGLTAEHVCIAQLHYTVVRQLGRTYDLLQLNELSELLPAAMSMLVGAQDCAFELLERHRSPGTYGPWTDKKRGAGTPVGGHEAQKRWKQTNNYPLQNIRDYRNNLVHGRTAPAIVANGIVHVPKIGKELAYFDWRLVTGVSNPPIGDFDTPQAILQGAFDQSVAYFESAWKANLAPHV